MSELNPITKNRLYNRYARIYIEGLLNALEILKKYEDVDKAKTTLVNMISRSAYMAAAPNTKELHEIFLRTYSAEIGNRLD